MNFTRFLTILHARFGVIAATTALAVLAAALVSLIMPARYYAEASAVLEQPALDAAAIAAGGATSLTYFLATQRDVVASRNVALRVIDSLGLEKDPENSRRLLTRWNPLGWLRGLIARLLPGDAGEAMSFRDWMVERLLKESSITSSRDSRLLKVGFYSPAPEFSAAVANAFMHAFLDANVQLKAAPARTETAWLQGQLKELRENLAQAEAKLSAFQQEKGIVATDERVDHENQTLSDLSMQLAGAQSEAYAASARRRQLQQFAGGQGGAGDVPSDVVTSPVVMRLREDIAQREAKLRDMSRQLGPNHPRYRASAGELEQLRGQLGVEMRSVAQGLASAGNVAGEREASLRGAVAQQKTRILGMKKEREQMAMLARDVENAQRAYNGAEQRVAQSRIESANQRPNASVVDEAAVPTRPASPRVTFNLALGGVLGAMLGLGIALLLESAQRLVRGEDDLVEVLGVPILAVLPPRALRGPLGRALGANVYSLPKP
jgi:chain length determinant protein EpsF